MVGKCFSSAPGFRVVNVGVRLVTFSISFIISIFLLFKKKKIYIYIIFCFIMWLMQPHVTPNSLVSGMFNFQSSSF